MRWKAPGYFLPWQSPVCSNKAPWLEKGDFERAGLYGLSPAKSPGAGPGEPAGGARRRDAPEEPKGSRVSSGASSGVNVPGHPMMFASLWGRRYSVLERTGQAGSTRQVVRPATRQHSSRSVRFMRSTRPFVRGIRIRGRDERRVLHLPLQAQEPLVTSRRVVPQPDAASSGPAGGPMAQVELHGHPPGTMGRVLRGVARLLRTGRTSLYHRPVPHVYILRCRDGSLYTGATTDLARRLRQHRAGTASRYTRSRLPVELVWKRRVASWSAALREERRIKALPRPAKLLLAVGSAVAASNRGAAPRVPAPARPAAGRPRTRSDGRTPAGSSRS